MFRILLLGLVAVGLGSTLPNQPKISALSAVLSAPMVKLDGLAEVKIIVKYRPEAIVVSPAVAARRGESLAEASGNAELASLDAIHQKHSLDLTRAKPLFVPNSTGVMVLDQALIQARVANVRRRFARRKPPVGTAVPDLGSIYALPVPADQAEEILLALKADPAVAYAEPVYECHTTTLPDDTYVDPDQDGIWNVGSYEQAFSDLWGMEIIQAEQAWEIGQGGQGVIVAVIDTGLDTIHEDIAANVWINTAELQGIPGVDDDQNGYVDDLHGYDFVNDDGDPADGHGHGTHVSGTVAAPINSVGVVGVAPFAQVMALKGLNNGGAGSTDDLALAIVYAAENGANVLNNSWSGVGSSDLITDVFRFAHSMGCVCVAAAGNNSDNLANSFPANIDVVISVAATDDLDEPASFTNFGELLDVAAPGVVILSIRSEGTDFFGDRLHFVPPGDLDARYYLSNGTSMASPHVAGFAALLAAAAPGLTNDDIRAAMQDTADDLGPPGFDIFFGHGRINVGRAILELVDCNGNGSNDQVDIDEGISLDCNANGKPDECEPGGSSDCNSNGLIDLCEIHDGLSEDCQDDGVPDGCEEFVDCNTNSLFDPCELRDGLAADCNLNGIPDECDLAAGGDLDCNDNSIPDGCEEGANLDCNDNSVSDLCDIAVGTSNDCNLNAIPDECDLQRGSSFDCNDNSVPDECDVSTGISADCDGNGFPDECLTAFDPVVNVNELDGTDGYVIAGAFGGAGRSVSAAGDVNGDGLDDVVVGAPFVSDFTRLHFGLAFVVYGGSSVGATGAVNLLELDGSNGYAVDGLSTDLELGTSVSSAGDINADGLADVLIGGPGINVTVDDLAGDSFAVFGASSVGTEGVLHSWDLFGRDGFQIPGLDVDDRMGSAVAGLGDINGDHIDDFVLGARAANGAGSGSSTAGEAYVFFGSQSLGIISPIDVTLLEGSTGFLVHGAFIDDAAGTSVSGGGDLNGDGYNEIIVGAPSARGALPPFGGQFGGEAYVIFGGDIVGAGGLIERADLDGAGGFLIQGELVWGNLGTSCAAAGDVNADGYDDLIVGNPGPGPDLDRSGFAYVFFGGPDIGQSGILLPSQLNGSNGFAINGLTGFDGTGRRLSGGGDVNGDGVDDLIVQADHEVYVIFGSPSLGAGGQFDPASLDGSNGFVVRTNFGSALFFNDVSVAGDLNADGIDDVIIGSAGASGGRGEAYVIFGRSSPLDCNGNSLTDVCEIAQGLAADCNDNGIPDECLNIEMDCNTNGTPDACDVASNGLPDCNSNGVPDLCQDQEADCNNNGAPDQCDIAEGTSTDCNGNGVPDECNSLEFDCNNNGVPDPCDVQNGPSSDCNANGIPDECIALEFDCNNNGIPDACDITSGLLPDCNTNGWPDGCEIARGSISDCNTNGVPDACDISAGASSDCNTNGIADDCEEGWAADCNSNGVSDLCDVAEGNGHDFNDNAVLDECEPNRNIRVRLGDGCSEEPTGEFDDPFCSIQQAIFNSIPGDEIVLDTGVYTGQRNMNFFGRSITIRCADGPAGGPGQCIIDLEHAGRAFSLANEEDADAVIEGLIIINGSASQGGAIFCEESNPTIRNCIITDCTALIGGAVYCLNGSATLENSIIARNSAELGGGFFVLSEAASVRHCTFVENLAIQGGAVACLGTALAVDQTILWENSATQGPSIFAFESPPASAIVVRYCDVQGGQSSISLDAGSTLIFGDTNLDADPRFADLAAGDYQLRRRSPCLGSGDPAFIPQADERDVHGDDRVIGTVVDIGADEFLPHLETPSPPGPLPSGRPSAEAGSGG